MWGSAEPSGWERQEGGRPLRTFEATEILGRNGTERFPRRRHCVSETWVSAWGRLGHGAPVWLLHHLGRRLGEEKAGKTVDALGGAHVRGKEDALVWVAGGVAAAPPGRAACPTRGAAEERQRAAPGRGPWAVAGSGRGGCLGGMQTVAAGGAHRTSYRSGRGEHPAQSQL